MRRLEKRQRGRPRKEQDEKVSVRLFLTFTPKEYSQLVDICNALDISKTQFVRDAIKNKGEELELKQGIYANIDDYDVDEEDVNTEFW